MVFQPLIIPSLVVALMFYVVPEATSVPAANRWSLWLLIMETTLLIPMLSVIGMRMTSLISSIHMVKRKERVWPFAITTFFYLMTTAFFYLRLNGDSLLVFSLSTITLCIFILTVITYFWKISAHLTGLSGLLAILLVMASKFPSHSLLYLILVGVMLCGLVGSARLYLDAHKPSEILGGFILGFSVCLIAFVYYLF